MSLSLYCPHASPEPTSTAWWVALAASLGVDVWFGHNLHTSTVAGVGYAAGRGHRTGIGQGVTLIPTVTSHSAAADLSALHRLTGRRVRGYYSPGYPALQELTHGRPWHRPLQQTRHFLHRLHVTLDLHGTRAHTELGLGVLRPKMAHLAGEHADGAITWLTGAPWIGHTLRPALAAGAARAGRRQPRLIATLHVGGDDTDLGQQAGTALAGHLRAPHYRRLLRDQDVPAGDDAGDALVRAGLFTGPRQARYRIKELRDAGADEIAVVLHAPRDVEVARHTWHTISQ